MLNVVAEKFVEEVVELNQEEKAVLRSSELSRLNSLSEIANSVLEGTCHIKCGKQLVYIAEELDHLTSYATELSDDEVWGISLLSKKYRKLATQ